MNEMNSSFISNITSDMILSNISAQQTTTLELMKLYFQFEFASVIVLILLAAVTIPTNILLLVMVWIDPLKCFKKPTTPFIIGLAVADLLTALTTEPFFAVYYYIRHVNNGQASHKLTLLYRAGQFVSTLAISSSFLIVLALSWSQFIAVAFPHRYVIWITRRRVAVCVIVIWMYFLGFSLLQFSNIDMLTYFRVDLILHPTLISAVLLVTIVMLYRSFQNEIKRKRSFLKHKQEDHSQRRTERQFTIVTIYLASIILASALPHVVVQYAWLYASPSIHGQLYLWMAIRVRDLLLFLKVALDAFIYAWRLKIYRKTLMQVFGGCRCSLLHCKTVKRQTDEQGLSVSV